MTIKIKRKIRSTLLRIKELEKFKDKNVFISITPADSKSGDFKKELLKISQWHIKEEDLRVKSWKLPNY